MLASGNLGLVSFPDVPHRMTREEIDPRHPALLATLANHPGIGFLLVRSEEHGRWCSARAAPRSPWTSSTTDPGPLADFGPGAADAVRRTDGFPHTADIMVNSWYDPGDGRGPRLRGADRLARRPRRRAGQPFLLSPLTLATP